MARVARIITRQSLPLTWSSGEVAEWNQAAARVRAAKDQGKIVVLVTGVFDLLHNEHVNFLAKARQVGNYLLVGVESDARVRLTKGPDRPVRGQAERVHDVLGTGYVDDAVVLPESFSAPAEHSSLIELIRPHIFAVSSQSPHIEAKRAIVERFGSELRIVHDHNPAVSTTQLVAAGKME